eukprot:TRINITY_DN5275_c0_g2_i1.p1 TRINITY_DN5275_c0_g2~~TRINITY_DN5275_c0_g2_i1.p1  ORF type:complete len:290 (+),score=110.07 TRINITY_DN5275_c0_g2_i1:456-1325(+)
MFEEIPIFLKTKEDLLRRAIKEPPPEAISLHLILNFFHFFSLLQKITPSQLLSLSLVATSSSPSPSSSSLGTSSQLSHSLPPYLSPSLSYPFTLLKKLQVKIQEISKEEEITQLHHVLSTTPPNYERQKLHTLLPTVSNDLISIFLDLVKLPFDEFLSFFSWFPGLDVKDLVLLVQSFQLLNVAMLLEIKTLFEEKTQQLQQNGNGNGNGTTTTTTAAANEKKEKDSSHFPPSTLFPSKLFLSHLYPFIRAFSFSHSFISHPFPLSIIQWKIKHHHKCCLLYTSPSPRD